MQDDCECVLFLHCNTQFISCATFASFACSLTLSCSCVCIWPKCKSRRRIRAIVEKQNDDNNNNAWFLFTPFYVRWCGPCGFRLIERYHCFSSLFFFIISCVYVCQATLEKEVLSSSVGMEWFYMDCYAASLLECHSYYCYFMFKMMYVLLHCYGQTIDNVCSNRMEWIMA